MARRIDWDTQPLGKQPDWEIAERNGVTKGAVAHARKVRGIPRHRPPPRHRQDGARLTYQGQTKTVAEWAESIGLRYETLHKRLNSGWSPERALSTPRKPYDHSPIEHNGEHKTLTEWAASSGLAPPTLRSRLRCGWTLAHALTIPTKPTDIGRPISHNGQTKTLTEWAASVGLSLSTVWTRLQRGWTLDRALATPAERTDLTRDLPAVEAALRSRATGAGQPEPGQGEAGEAGVPRGAKVSEEKYVRVRPLLAEGLSDLEISRRTGIHRNTVARYRTGKSVPASMRAEQDNTELRALKAGLSESIRHLQVHVDIQAQEIEQRTKRGPGQPPIALDKARALLELVAEGLSDIEIGRRVGVHRNTVWRYRTGISVPVEIVPAPRPTFLDARSRKRRHRLAPPLVEEGLDRWADDGGRMVRQPRKSGPKYLLPAAGLHGAERYKANLALGFCVKCQHSPHLPGKTRCAPCLLYALVKTYQKAARRMRAGQCVRCGRQVGTRGVWRCEPCLEARRGHAAGARASEPSAPPSLDALLRRATELGASIDPRNMAAVKSALKALAALVAEMDAA